MIQERQFYEYINKIKKLYDSDQTQIIALREENRKLKSENYKDNELSEMKQNLENIQKDYWRGFPISEEEEKAIEAWKKNHDKQEHGYTPNIKMKTEGCCGGRYKYVFVPTSLGVSGKIVCHCGAEFEFQKIG